MAVMVKTLCPRRPRAGLRAVDLALALQGRPCKVVHNSSSLVGQIAAWLFRKCMISFIIIGLIF
jgi:hypothetical protein